METNEKTQEIKDESIVDLRNCKKGDKLLTKHGTILIYVEPEPENSYYDHKVRYSNGSFGQRTHNGQVYRNKRLSIDEDIIRVIKEDDVVFNRNLAKKIDNLKTKRFLIEQNINNLDLILEQYKKEIEDLENLRKVE